MIVFGSVTNQDIYSQISELVSNTSGYFFSNSWGEVGQAGLLLIAAFAGGSASASTDQLVYLAVSLLYIWLTTVWLIREHTAGRKPKLRDGLYNSGAPFISTLLVLSVMFIQLLPVGVVALAYSGLSSVGVIESGFGAMLFYCLAGFVAIVSMYWLTSTIIALVVVTLPGMYPMRALRIAGDLVIGRRLRILYRLLWLVMVTIVAWFAIMIPIILIDSWANRMWPQTSDVPIVPYFAVVMNAFVTIWSCSYVYLLYRRIVDDDAKPA